MSNVLENDLSNTLPFLLLAAMVTKQCVGLLGLLI